MSHHTMTDSEIKELLSSPKRIAVIGMKPEGAALSIPEAMADAGFEVVGVNPKYNQVGEFDVYPTVDQVPGAIDIVDVFRRSDAVPEHVPEILKMEPPPDVVWLQLGIRNDGVGEQLEEHGIRFVQDRCLKVEYNRLVAT